MVKCIKDIVFKIVSDAQPVINPKQQAIKNARYTHREAKLLDIEEDEVPINKTRTKRSTAGKPPIKLTYAVIPQKRSKK